MKFTVSRVSKSKETWEVELESLEDLIKLSEDEDCEVILSVHGNNNYNLIIYDAYIEM